jgi:hypothetical protein
MQQNAEYLSLELRPGFMGSRVHIDRLCILMRFAPGQLAAIVGQFAAVRRRLARIRRQPS